MAMAQRPWAAEILHVWFDILGPGDRFGGGAAIDTMLRQRFAREWHMLRHRPASEFLNDPLTARAAVLLFDQVPRNIFRDSPLAFASDPLARAIAKGALKNGWDRGLGDEQRQFLAMPLMHSEGIADQLWSLRYYSDNPDVLAFARSHYRMIARFGRYPHRNAVLGRRSTPAEEAAVAAGNSW